MFRGSKSKYSPTETLINEQKHPQNQRCWIKEYKYNRLPEKKSKYSSRTCKTIFGIPDTDIYWQDRPRACANLLKGLCYKFFLLTWLWH